MSIFKPIGSNPSIWTPAVAGIGGTLIGMSQRDGTSSSTSTSPTTAGSMRSGVRSGTTRAKTSTPQSADAADAASLKQALFDALTAMGDVLGAGLPTPLGAASPSRAADGRATDARLEATIAGYFRH